MKEQISTIIPAVFPEEMTAVITSAVGGIRKDCKELEYISVTFI
jgi:hypothetical protein